MNTVTDIIQQNGTFTEIAAFLLSMSVTAAMVPFIIKESIKRGWVDLPNHRKIHKIPIPRLGGIAIFSGLMFCVLFYSLLSAKTDLAILTGAVSVIFIMGVTDDRIELPATFKFIIQIIVAFAVSALGFRIKTLHGIMNIYELPLIFQYLLTIIILTGLVNAYNLIDGIDGLAGGLSLINSMVFGILFYAGGETAYAVYSFALGGASMGFLFFNFKHAKIFMGDNGSLVIGFSMAFLGIVYFNTNPAASGITLNLYTLVFASMLLPAYDTVRVFAERISMGISPFTPGKNHIHHLLLQTGFDQLKAVSIIYSANIALMLASMLLKGKLLNFGIIYLLFLTIILSELITLRMWIQNLFEKKYVNSETLNIKNENYLLYKHLIEKS